MPLNLDTKTLRVLLALGVILGLLTWSTNAHCEEADQGGVLDEAVVHVERSERAPFDGMLFPVEMAIRLGLRVENLEARLRLDVQRERDQCASSLRFEVSRRESEIERREFQITQLQAELDRSYEEIDRLRAPAPWYRRWGFAFAMGMVVTGLFVAGGVALLVGVL